MSKVIHVKTCYDCPHLRLTPFSRGGFECRQNTISKLIVTSVEANDWKDAGFVIPHWCPLDDATPAKPTTSEATRVAAKCCAIILSIDSNRGNEKQAAEAIANDFGIDMTKLLEGGYHV